jgi:hypothetical protein
MDDVLQRGVASARRPDARACLPDAHAATTCPPLLHEPTIAFAARLHTPCCWACMRDLPLHVLAFRAC